MEHLDSYRIIEPLSSRRPTGFRRQLYVELIVNQLGDHLARPKRKLKLQLQSVLCVTAS